MREALTGHFEDHHACICAATLRRADALAADITALDARIEELIAPFAQAAARLDEPLLFEVTVEVSRKV